MRKIQLFQTIEEQNEAQLLDYLKMSPFERMSLMFKLRKMNASFMEKANGRQIVIHDGHRLR